MASLASRMSKKTTKLFISSLQPRSCLQRAFLEPSCSGQFVGFVRCLQDIPRPETFENVIYPPEGCGPMRKLPRTPTFNAEIGQVEFKETRRKIEGKGPEQIHTFLLHEQFGIVAREGGRLGPKHFDIIENVVNRHMNDERFAVWRIEDPWLPVTKKRAGTRMGGGKGSIHHYAVPVRAGRIILEVGGRITYAMAQSFLVDIADKMPFRAEFVTHKDLLAEQELRAKIARENINPYSWEFVTRWNMQNVKKWLPEYEFIWKGQYR